MLAINQVFEIVTHKLLANFATDLHMYDISCADQQIVGAMIRI